MKRSAVVTGIVFILALIAFASESAAQQEESEETKANSIDPSLTGESGIIGTLIADSLPKGSYSLGIFYHNFDRELTDVDVNQFAISLAYGLLENLEIAFSVIGVWQLDYDEPVHIEIFPPPVLNAFPFPQSTIEEGFGDVYFGAKYTFLEESEQAPGMAFRGFVKIPTGNEEEGFGSGATDFGLDLIISKRVSNSFLLTGNAGFTFLGTPGIFGDAGLSFGNDFRYGIGGKLFATEKLRVLMELTGTIPFSDSDFPQGNITDLRLGLEYKFNNGLRFGLGWTRTLMFEDPALRPDGAFAMISFSPFARKPPKEIEVPEVVEPEEVVEEEEVEPEEVEEEEEVPEEEVVEPEEFAPVDIYFDFDRYNLRPASVQELNKLAAYLKEHADATILVEGHCCYIGTDEYNLALGEMRARAIKDYLVRQGLAADRIETISWGETKPAFDNSKESTRQFNRRGHFVISLSGME